MTVPVTTQQEHPLRATLRTGIAVVGGVASITPYVVEIVEDGLTGWEVAGLGGQIVAVAGIITRIMALPQVDRALECLKLGSSPDVKPSGDHAA